MARMHFSIHIDISDVGEAADFISRMEGFSLQGAEEVYADKNVGAAGEGTQGGEPDPQADAPKTRGRPRKPQTVPEAAAQLAADNPVATAPVAGVAPSTSQPTAAATATAPVATGPSDLERELMGVGPAATADMVMKAMQAHIEKHEAVKTLGVIEANTSNGAKSFKQIAADDYGRVHAALQAELA